MGGEGIGGGADGGTERQLPPPRRAGDWRRCQSLGGARGVLETEGSGLCGRGLESGGAGPTYPRACGGSRLSGLVPCSQGDRTSNSGGTAAASGEDQILSGAARSGFRSQNAERSDRLPGCRVTECKASCW